MTKSSITVWLTAAFFLICIIPTFCQVGIGSLDPHVSSILDVKASNKGFLPPRLSEGDKLNIIEPAIGLIIYNTSRNCLEVNTGNATTPTWKCLGTEGTDITGLANFAGNSVTIDPNTVFQTIEGWGVNVAWWGNLAGGTSQNTIDELASYAVNDLNFNIFRFNIGGGDNPSCPGGDHMRKDGGKMPGYRSFQLDNQGFGVVNLTNDARQIAVMNKLAELRAPKNDIITEITSYSPPWWMTHSNCTSGNVVAADDNIDPDYYDDFADYLASVTKSLTDAYPSWNIKYIAPFNEPRSGFWQQYGSQEGTNVDISAQAAIINELYTRKNNLGLSNVEIAVADNSSVEDALTNITDLKDNYQTAYSRITKVNTHSYFGLWWQKRDLNILANNNGTNSKTVWQSESGPLNWNPPAPDKWWVRHYFMAYRIIEDLRNLKSVVWCDWQLMSKDNGWGMLQDTSFDPNEPYETPNLEKTRGFYARKNFTNFIKKGYKIIENSNGIIVTALSPSNTELVIVMANRFDTTENLMFDLTNFSTINGLKTYRTSGSDEISGENTEEKLVGSVTQKGVIANGALNYTAPPYSVTTFVIDITGSI